MFFWYPLLSGSQTIRIIILGLFLNHNMSGEKPTIYRNLYENTGPGARLYYSVFRENNK